MPCFQIDVKWTGVPLASLSGVFQPSRPSRLSARCSSGAFRKLTVKDLTEFEIEFYARNTRAGRRGLEMFEDPPHQTEPQPTALDTHRRTAPGDQECL